VSIPRIPGPWSANRPESLADLWGAPEGIYPLELWPRQVLRDVVSQPTEWITVVESYFDEEQHGGRGAVLVRPEDVELVLSCWSWVGKGLGGFGLWSDGRVETGLAVEERGVRLEFLGQVRDQHDVRSRVVEVALPFLWYWDAIRKEDGWYYLNSAGRDQQLVRYQILDDHYKVEIRALELRQYVLEIGRVLIAQVDHVTKIGVQELQELDDSFTEDWANFSWHCWGGNVVDPQCWSRMVGQYAIRESESPRLPWWKESKRGLLYPEFQYDIDHGSGRPLMHTCDPDQLGTYFDGDGSRLHYLTPVYFTPDVLDRYIREPSRYRVRATRLSCLDMWSVAISRNTVGLVEVYLGDIGRDLPADEWSHWRTHNVPPEGAMAEDRVRRDFLNQWTSTYDPVSMLRTLRDDVNDIAGVVFGGPIWRSLTEPDKTEWEGLHPPVSTEPRSLHAPVLTLTKAMVDAIDKVMLRAFLKEQDRSRPSLALLEDAIEALNGDRTMVEPLRALQGLRSGGGIAHMVGKGRKKALLRMGIRGLNPQEGFETIAARIVETLLKLGKLLKKHHHNSRETHIES